MSTETTDRSTAPQHERSGVPDGYRSVTPWVIVDDAAGFIRFAKGVFDAVDHSDPVYTDENEQRIAHAELRIGDSVVMVFDRGAGWGPTRAFLNLFVPDCDATHHRALAAGAEEITPLADNAWGGRGSRIRDPFGNVWWLQTHLEDLTLEEAMQRMEDPHLLRNVEEAMRTLDEAMRQDA